MDKLIELEKRIDFQITVENATLPQVYDKHERTKRLARQEALFFVKQWIGELNSADKLTELEKKIESQSHLEDARFCKMLDEVRVRRNSAPISGSDLYNCAVHRDQLRIINTWIRELREQELQESILGLDIAAGS